MMLHGPAGWCAYCLLLPAAAFVPPPDPSLPPQADVPPIPFEELAESRLIQQQLQQQQAAAQQQQQQQKQVRGHGVWSLGSF
jgi:hypothetical protein